MKKILARITTGCLFSGLLSIAGCNISMPTSADTNVHDVAGATIEAPSAMQAADQVYTLINALNDSADARVGMSQIIDADGLRLAPYYTLKTSDQILSQAEFSHYWSNNDELVYGVQPGSGNAIKMALPEYWSKFYILDQSVSHDMSQISQPEDFVATGNMRNTILSTYPPSEFALVEYYQPGVEPRYGGMDWRSVVIVLKPVDEKQWRLAALIGGQWTI